MKKYPTFINGCWFTWIPLPGMDLSVGGNSLRIGAAVYGHNIVEGLSEVKAHQLAEKAVFESHYRVKY